MLLFVVPIVVVWGGVLVAKRINELWLELIIIWPLTICVAVIANVAAVLLVSGGWSQGTGAVVGQAIGLGLVLSAIFFPIALWWQRKKQKKYLLEQKRSAGREN